MPRLRGIRRICLIIASALPLLADVPLEPKRSTITDNGHNNINLKHNVSLLQQQQRPAASPQNTEKNSPWSASQHVMEDETLTRLPTLRAVMNDWAEMDTQLLGQQHYNVVVPFRPRTVPRGKELPPEEAADMNGNEQSTSENKMETSENKETEVSIESNNATISTTHDETEVEVASVEVNQTVPEANDAFSTDANVASDNTDDVEETSESADDAEEKRESADGVEDEKDRNDDTKEWNESVDDTEANENEKADDAEEKEESTENTDKEDTESSEEKKEVSDDAEEKKEVISEDSEDIESDNVKSVKFDFASKSAGALILEKSAGWNGASSLLTSDNDRYAIIPCSETSKSVVISLSEDILIKIVVLANYERYSSTVKDFQLLGSQTMGKWVDLGTYTAKRGGGKQEFELDEYSWARYLKVRVLSHYGDEHYLTISQLSVYGDTMLQGFHEDWEEEQEEEGVEDQRAGEEEAASGIESAEANVGASSAWGPSGGETGTEGSVNEKQISEFQSNEVCTTELDSVCPKDLNFEQLVFMYSTNHSYFEKMSALSSASLCRNLSKYEHEPLGEFHMQSLSPPSTMADNSREEAGDSRVLSTKDDTVAVDTADSPVISQIQQLIKSAAGIDVDLSQVNALFNTDTDGHEDGADNTDAPQEPEPTEAADSQNSESLDVVQQKESPSQASTSSTTPESKASIQSTLSAEEWEKLLNALERVPSSDCLKEIDISEFRKRIASSKNSSSGTGNGSSTGGSVEMQPIFKRLTAEIKTLQGTLSIQEDFMKGTASCYQRVLLELVVQQEEARARTEKRLEDMERAIKMYLGWLQFITECCNAVVRLVASTWSSLRSSWPSSEFHSAYDVVAIVSIATTAFFATRLLFFYGGRWLRRKFSSRREQDSPSSSTVQQARLAKTCPPRDDGDCDDENMPCPDSVDEKS